MHAEDTYPYGLGLGLDLLLHAEDTSRPCILGFLRILVIRTPGFGLDLTRGSQTSQDVPLALAGRLEAAEGVHGPQLPREVLFKSSSSCACDERGKRFLATKSRANFALNSL